MRAGIRKPISLLACLIALTAALLTAGAYGQQKSGPGYDGQWWLSATSEEQAGFLNGYQDCYASEYNGPPSYWVEDPEAARPAITSYYRADPAAERSPVSDVFSQLPARQPDETPGREAIKGRHSIYDGSYWKQISVLGGPERGQLGFVEGYLACHTSLAHNKGGVFSKTPVEYMALISQWYQYDEYTSEINRRRARKPISEVLYKFKD